MSVEVSRGPSTLRTLAGRRNVPEGPLPSHVAPKMLYNGRSSPGRERHIMQATLM